MRHQHNQGIRYVVGVDVGSRSLGLSAIETSPDGTPLRLLSCLSFIHDGGVDPNGGQKQAITRLASSGVARRTRRRLKQRRRRLRSLDALLESYGWPTGISGDDAWMARATLSAGYISDSAERERLLASAVRHIARHRGWRSPYSRIETLLTPAPPSAAFEELRAAAAAQAPRLPADATVGQLAAVLLRAGRSIRNRRATADELTVRLECSDIANELLTIADTQRLPQDQTRALILTVFAAASPKGAQKERIAADPLPTHRLPGAPARLPRASKASDEFQRYRIVTILANLRIRAADGPRRLNVAEREKVLEHLLTAKPTHDPTWDEVAALLGIPREHLAGTATTTADGERSHARPPVHATDRTIRKTSIKPLRDWWNTAEGTQREALVAALSNGASDVPDDPAVDEFLATLPPDQLVTLDGLHLPTGRAAYSRQSLTALTQQMLETEDDLHDARAHLFGVPANWAPPADPIGAPVGNPAVDRVVKQTARWLLAAEAHWGRPERITIEHVRASFVSEKKKREIDQQNSRHHAARTAAAETVAAAFGVDAGDLTPGHHRKYEQVARQRGACLYCGTGITVRTAQLDHIVPRKTPGSSNRSGNLVATCGRCNTDKGNRPFAAWAATTAIPGVSVAAAVERVDGWVQTPGQHPKAFKAIKNEVTSRLRRTEYDPPLDDRSMESVGWMANELATRIRQHFAPTAEHAGGVEVTVYRGALVAEARKASAVEWSLPWIGGPEGGKTRLDRRHHAIDASVVALIDDRSAARTLAERIAIRDEERARGLPKHTLGWKTHTGRGEKAQQKFADWLTRMDALTALLAEAMAHDQVPVVTNLRLRPGGPRHADTIRRLYRLRVSDPIPVRLIDAATTPALWCALTRHPDYDPYRGLPADPTRTIRLHDRRLGPTDEIGFFDLDGLVNTDATGKPVKAPPASLAVRDGSAALGATIHHARVYRIDSNGKTTFAVLRVYTTDLASPSPMTRDPQRRNPDLLSPTDAPLPLQSISVRTTNRTLRTALTEGTATFLGYLLPGDEIVVPNPHAASADIAAFAIEHPDIVRWQITGFETENIVNLRPLMMSSEGMPDHASPATRKALTRVRPAFNKLAHSGDCTIIRRDALGRERWQSTKHLPLSWTIG